MEIIDKLDQITKDLAESNKELKNAIRAFKIANEHLAQVKIPAVKPRIKLKIV